ncbi:MAG: nucleotidyltransferase family protein [Lachnospiraceae bacterium]|nr:nucleotidyltransferase family protein [Lachnospiraceae bacterium]
MKTAAIIAEFNPFHEGHAHLIREARRQGADRVLVLMSGDYVQRGEPAIFDRYVRTSMALTGGADLVISYPARFAASSAESFASHAVSILNAVKTADCLVFGSESADPARLKECASILLEEPQIYRDHLRAGLKSGLSFPKARAEALPSFADLLSGPNDILAIEYLKALYRTGSSIKPVAIPRIGTEHHGTKVGPYASAAAIRSAVFSGNEAIKSAVPSAVCPLYQDALHKQGAMHPDYYSDLIAGALWAASSPEDLAVFADVTEELSMRLFAKRSAYRGFTLFTKLCASRSLTESHVRRALLHMALSIRKGESGGHFCHILGFRKEAADLLAAVKKNAEIPVIINPPSDARLLEGQNRRLFDEEVRLHGLYGSILSVRNGCLLPHLYAEPVQKW